MKKAVFALLLLASTLAMGCNALMKGNSALRNENYAEAIAAFKEQLASNPADWQSREKLGYAYLKAGDANAAIAELQKVVAEQPKEGQNAYLYLGLAQLKLGDQTKALAALRSFTDKDKPLVKAEVDRLITLVEIEESKKLAKQALAQEAQLSRSATKPNSYAVFNFNVKGSDDALRAIQKALTAMTITDLAQIKGISVIERARLQALIDEMKLGQSGAVDESTAPKAGRLLGAENLVVGNLSDPTGKIGVASTTASTTRGAAVGSFSLAEVKDKFYELQKQVVANIIKVNNIKVEGDAANLLKQYHTRSFQAAAFYGQGLDAEDRGDFQASKDYFALAAKEDPNFVLARNARDRSPGGLSGAAIGNAAVVGLKTIESAVAAQTSANTGGAVVSSSGRSAGAGGGGGHSSCS